jgi:hypothetical protein
MSSYRFIYGNLYNFAKVNREYELKLFYRRTYCTRKAIFLKLCISPIKGQYLK